MAKLIDYAEVTKHNSPGDAWVVVGSTVYDLSEFAPSHPGGAKYIHKYAGKVATEEFEQNHPQTIIQQTLGREPAQKLGEIDPATLTAQAAVANDGFEPKPQDGAGIGPNAGPRRRSRPGARRASVVGPAMDEDEELPPLEACLNTFDYELVAKKKMAMTGKTKGWDYYSSGGDDEMTLRENASAFQRIWLKPRVLRDVSVLDPSTEVFGVPWSLPVYLSSVAMQKMGHPDGELAWIRGAHSQGIVHLLPTLSGVAMQDMFDEAKSIRMKFNYQLYMNQDRGLVEDVIKAAGEAGCQALFVTVDAPQLGRRERDMRNKTEASSGSAIQSKKNSIGSDKIAKNSGGGTSAAISAFIDPSLNWSDIEWVKQTVPPGMKVVLKGVQTGIDAVLAFKAGVQGIVVSNHGGRQVDTARSGIEILPEVMDALHAEFSDEELARFTILMDGGVRRGTDIFKAIALGADGCGIGKPAAYAMSAYGQPGIEKMLTDLHTEFLNVMQLMGCTTVAQIKAEGKHMLDTKYLDAHLMPGPNDKFYESNNVLGKAGPSAAIASMMDDWPTKTTTTITTTTGVDGSVTTTSETVTEPVDSVSEETELRTFELHGYQKDFLERAAVAQNLPSDAAVLQRLVDFAMKEDAVKAAIFDETFHCVHCDSKSPPDWIQSNKGDKKPYELKLTDDACEFLGGEILLQVGPPGPDKQVIPGPKHADPNKAVRCCIDWAIKTFDAELVWYQLHGYQYDFLGQMAALQDLGSPAAALQKIVNLAMTDPQIKAAIFDETFHCVHCNSKDPPDWIQNSKGTYIPYALPLTPISCAFLQMEMLLEVGPPGPEKAVIPGSLHSDSNKAVRCCIDWAIKEFQSQGAALGFDAVARL